MKHYRLFLLIILCVPMGCKKDTPAKSLPPVTQEGKNMAGFLLDGEAWVPFAECGFFRDPCEEISARYGPPGNFNNYLSFQISQDYENVSSTLTITSLVPIKQPGEYFDSVNIEFLAEIRDANLRSFTESLNYPDGNFIITRLDTVAQVMAGTFSFTLNNREGKTVEITEGRFDFKMDACICSE